MKRANGIRDIMYSALVVAPLVLLPGCDWLNKNCCATGGGQADAAVNDGSKVLATLDNKPVLSENMLEAKLQELMEENPQFKAMMPFMPIRKNLFDAMLSDLVFRTYVDRQGISESAEYQADKARLLKSVESMLNAKYFSKAHPVTVSDADVTKFYHENKDTIPQLLISRGGFKTIAVKCDTEAAGKEFLAKVRETGDISKAAQAAGLKDKLKDFHLVTADSASVDAEVKKFVMGVKKFPTHEMVKSTGKTCWVVSVTKKEEAKYRDFDEIKDQLKQYLEKQRESEEMQKRVEEYKNSYGIKVEVDDAFFKPAAQMGGAEEQEARNAQPKGPQAAQGEKPEQASQVA